MYFSYHNPILIYQKELSKIIPFNQTLKDIEKLFRDVSGYYMIYDVFKHLCRKSW